VIQNIRESPIFISTEIDPAKLLIPHLVGKRCLKYPGGIIYNIFNVMFFFKENKTYFNDLYILTRQSNRIYRLP
jgi:hypothetical protein